MQKETSKTLVYNDFKNDFSVNYGISYLDCSIIDRFGLICLLGFLSFKTKQKNPNIDTYQVLLKVINRNPESWEIKHFMRICAISDDFSMRNTQFETFGLKTVADISKEINRVLETLLPF